MPESITGNICPPFEQAAKTMKNGIDGATRRVLLLRFFLCLQGSSPNSHAPGNTVDEKFQLRSVIHGNHPPDLAIAVIDRECAVGVSNVGAGIKHWKYLPTDVYDHGPAYRVVSSKFERASHCDWGKRSDRQRGNSAEGDVSSGRKAVGRFEHANRAGIVRLSALGTNHYKQSDCQHERGNRSDIFVCHCLPPPKLATS